MKQMLSLIIAAALLVSLTGCGTPAPTEAVTEPPAGTVQSPQTEEPVSTGTADMSSPVAGTVLLEDENCAFTILDMVSNDYTGMELRVACRNKTDRTLVFSWNTVSVCGYMYDPLWSQAVEPGETVESAVSIDTYTLEGFGVTSVDEISFRLYIFDRENWMDEPVVDRFFDIYPTGLTADTVVYPQRQSMEGETVIVDDGNLTFIIEYAVHGEQTETLYCYLANKTDSTVMFSWDSVSIDGCLFYPGWAETVAPGKSACSEIVFSREEMRENGIDEIGRIEFNMIVSDYEDWANGYLIDDLYTYQPVYPEPVG